MNIYRYAFIIHCCFEERSSDYFPPHQILTWNFFLTESCARIIAVYESCFLGDLWLHSLQTVFAEFTELILV